MFKAILTITFTGIDTNTSEAAYDRALQLLDDSEGYEWENADIQCKVIQN